MDCDAENVPLVASWSWAVWLKIQPSLGECRWTGSRWRAYTHSEMFRCDNYDTGECWWTGRPQCRSARRCDNSSFRCSNDDNKVAREIAGLFKCICAKTIHICVQTIVKVSMLGKVRKTRRRRKVYRPDWECYTVVFHLFKTVFNAVFDAEFLFEIWDVFRNRVCMHRTLIIVGVTKYHEVTRRRELHISVNQIGYDVFLVAVLSNSISNWRKKLAWREKTAIRTD